MKRQSPIKEQPLKRAGDSRLNELRNKVMDRLIFFVVFPAAFVAGYWVRGLAKALPANWHVWLIGIAIAVIVGYGFFFIRRALKELDKTRLGGRGEMAVAEELAKLGRSDSEGRLLWREFHDIKLPRGGNADHVLVCEMGIYCLETKTMRQGSDNTLVFNGEQVCYLNGNPLPWSPIPQAKRNAAQLSEFLKTKSGEKHRVKAVVVFPGWNVNWTPDGEPEKARIIVCGTRGENKLSRIENNRRRVRADFLPLSPEKIKKIGDILEEANRRQ